MKQTKQQRSLRASNAAHTRLQNRAEKERTDWGEQRKIYHSGCRCRQEKLGRVLTRTEREAVMRDVISTFF